MNLSGNVSLKSMMMDCPRCGFNQPKDQFCAKCGIEVANFKAKPKSLGQRFAENTGLHIALALLVLAVAIGYLLTSESEMVSRQVTQLMQSTPVANTKGRDEAPAAAPPAKSLPEPESTPAPNPPSNIAPTSAAVATPPPPPAKDDAAAPEVRQLELNFYELGREALAGLIAGAERGQGDGNEGQAYLVKDVGRLADVLKSAHSLSAGRKALLRAGGQAMVITPPTTREPFQFGLAVQITRFEAREAQVQWNSQLVLPTPESPQEAASGNPALKPAIQMAFSGSAMLNATQALVLVIEPAVRRLSDDYLLKAGEGAWSIFSSEEFRHGESEWVAVAQLR